MSKKNEGHSRVPKINNGDQVKIKPEDVDRHLKNLGPCRREIATMYEEFTRLLKAIKGSRVFTAIVTNAGETTARIEYHYGEFMQFIAALCVPVKWLEKATK